LLVEGRHGHPAAVEVRRREVEQTVIADAGIDQARKLVVQSAGGEEMFVGSGPINLLEAPRSG
jgi:hypothetical protein